MINVQPLLSDPDFCQTLRVNRFPGNFQNGIFATTQTTVTLIGVVVPADTRDVVQTPDGDTIKGSIVIYSELPLQGAGLSVLNDGTGNLPDEVIWQGDAYKVITVENRSQYGFYRSVAARKQAAYSTPSV